MKDIEGITPVGRRPKQTLDPYSIFAFRIDAKKFGMSRDKFIKALNAEGIPVSPGYHNPLHHYSVFNDPVIKKNLGGCKIDYKKLSCPEAEKACAKEAVWLMHNVFLGTKADMEDIVRGITKIKESVTKK